MKVFLLILLFTVSSFAETRLFDCNLSIGNAAEPKAGQWRVKKDNSEMNIKFVLDTDDNTAQMIGNNGATEVMPINGPDSLTFIELTGFKNVNTTTIFLSTDNNLVVHSRHPSLLGKPLASQYYGECEIK